MQMILTGDLEMLRIIPRLTLCLTLLCAGVARGLLLFEWTLVSVDGAEATAQTTIRIDEPGRLGGQGPCNRYFADVTGPLPTFRPGMIGSTKMACPDMAAEAQYFAALQAIERAELTDDSLRLSGGGHELVFRKPLD
jgi:heat shock protein HslJ